MKKVFITGGAGYIGGHVGKRLRAQGISTLVFDNFSSGDPALCLGAPYVQGDVTDLAALARAMNAFQPDAVIHLAALSTVVDCTRQPERCRRVNEQGTRNVLQAMQAHGVPHLVFASSCAVYADSPDAAVLTEEAPLGPGTEYGASKLEAERIIHEFCAHARICASVLRLFNVVGADPDGEAGEMRSDETRLLPLALRTALGMQGALEVYGSDYPTPDGTACRDYVHVWDVADAFARALNVQEPCTLNIGTGAPFSVRQVVQAVEHETQRPLKVVLRPRRDNDSPWRVADASRAQRMLGWQPEYSSVETIVRTALHWHQRMVAAQSLTNSAR